MTQRFEITPTGNLIPLEPVVTGIEPPGYRIGLLGFTGGARWGFQSGTAPEWRGEYTSHLAAVYGAWEAWAESRVSAAQQEWTTWARGHAGVVPVGATPDALREAIAMRLGAPASTIKVGDVVRRPDLPDNAMARYSDGDVLLRRGDRLWWVYRRGIGWELHEGTSWAWSTRQWSSDATVLALDVPANATIQEIEASRNSSALRARVAALGIFRTLAAVDFMQRNLSQPCWSVKKNKYDIFVVNQFAP